MRQHQYNDGEPQIVLTNLRDYELVGYTLKVLNTSKRYKAELKLYGSPIIYFVINEENPDSLESKQQVHARLWWDMNGLIEDSENCARRNKCFSLYRSTWPHNAIFQLHDRI